MKYRDPFAPSLLTRLEGWLAPRWSRLTEVGNSRVLRTSYFWFFAVPPLASLLSRIGTEHTIHAFGSSWVLHLDLPFSWKVFYFAAAAFALGTSIFALRCPEIVRRYDSFAQFTSEGKGRTQIRDYFLYYLVRRRHDSVAAAVTIAYLSDFTSSLEPAPDDPALSLPDRQQMIDAIVESKIPSDRVPDAFWFVRNICDRSNPVSATLAGSCFFVGFLLTAWVLVQNFVYVWRLTFPDR